MVLMDPECPTTLESLASVEFDARLHADPRMIALQRDADELGLPGTWLAVPVSVSGTLEDNGRPACFAPRFSVLVTEIEFLGPAKTVTALTYSEHASAAPSN